MAGEFLEVHHGTWMKGHIHLLAIGILGLLLTAFSSACSEKSGKPASAAIPVLVSPVIQKNSTCPDPCFRV